MAPVAFTDRLAELIRIASMNYSLGRRDLTRHDVPLAILLLLLGSGVVLANYSPFCAIPTTMLGETAAAATFGLINSIGQFGGLAGNYTIGFLNDRTQSLVASFGLIAFCYVLAGSVILSLNIRARRDPDSFG